MTGASTLLWVRHAPYTTAHLSEAIRLAAMSSALGTTVRLLFVADGVRALVGGAEPYRLGPPIRRLLQDIVTDERPALVHAPSLERRGLSARDLEAGVALRLVDDDEAGRWIAEADRTVPL